VEQQSGSPEQPASHEPRDAVTPPEVLPVPDQAEAGPAPGELESEGAPIMSNLPRTRPQQRSRKRPAAKRAARTTASGSQKAATARSQARTGAGSAARGRSRASGAAGRRAPASPPAPARDSRGTAARALNAGVQVATAPLKLTVAATRTVAGVIGRGLRL
jgi:hypothetical protein